MSIAALLALIDGILDLSKIEAGKLDVAREPYAPASLVQDLMVSVEPLAKKNANKIELDCPADLGRGVGDPTRIRQCVLNLVGNACKFTSSGVVKVTARRATDHRRRCRCPLPRPQSQTPAHQVRRRVSLPAVLDRG